MQKNSNLHGFDAIMDAQFGALVQQNVMPSIERQKPIVLDKLS